jgi:hypothetical protein
MIALDTIDTRLLDEFQRGFPLEPRPFARIGLDLGLDEAGVIDRLARLSAGGAVARVGATGTGTCGSSRRLRMSGRWRNRWTASARPRGCACWICGLSGHSTSIWAFACPVSQARWV